jgi:hypothetical protein
MGTLHRLETRRPRPSSVEPDHELAMGLGVLLGLFWGASLARVAAAVSAHEVFGVEASLAFCCLLGIPWLALRALLRQRASRVRRHEVARKLVVAAAARKA